MAVNHGILAGLNRICRVLKDFENWVTEYKCCYLKKLSKSTFSNKMTFPINALVGFM